MPTLFTVPAGCPIAHHAAKHVLTSIAADQLPRAVLFVPTRRAAVTLREAFQTELTGRASLLPRIVPLADLGNELLTLLGPQAFDILESIPPAMPLEQQRYLLAEQILAFETRRMKGATLDYALALADELIVLQGQCARAEIMLSQAQLRPLFHADFATHWDQSLRFLGILTEHWPTIEQELGLTTSAARDVALLHAVAEEWKATPPNYPVMVIGSTASQHSTAALLKVVADMPNGSVILPGLDNAMPAAEWAHIAAGHPLYHLKHFLDLWPIAPSDVTSLAEAERSVWLDALAPSSAIPAWRESPLAGHGHLRLIACAHPEEESRVISLLLRESAENPAMRVALVTPDEGLMARVAVQLKRYGILANRLNAGTLATTQAGSLWESLLAAITAPERLLPLRSLLHHALMDLPAELLGGMEKGWHGVNRTRVGQLPNLPEHVRNHPRYADVLTLVRSIATLSRRQFNAPEWVEQCRGLFAPFVPQGGEGHEALEEQLAKLVYAEHFGPIAAEQFHALLRQQLDTSWRQGGVRSHPGIFMLTPVEARLQQFDRMILANLQESQWPGIPSASAWLNLAAQKAIGLPTPEEHISLMAHDMLMLGSGAEVFLTYPKRDQGSPSTRSRFIERLVTLLAMHGIAESAITADQYVTWANARDTSGEYAPHAPVMPKPSADERPRALPVSALAKLFSDPFSIYARHVLDLKRLDAIDDEPDASDFGTLAHRAMEALTQHWNTQARPANPDELGAIADHTLRDVSDRPNVALFWRTRLLGALRFVNGIEPERREGDVVVTPELTIEAPLGLDGGDTVTLSGRIDRVEDRHGSLTLVDYKTGDAPTTKDMETGHDVQLLVYAMLMAGQGVEVAQLEYWKLPSGGHAAEMNAASAEALAASDLPAKLHAALAQMLDASTPLLACPIKSSRNARIGNDYDGISRYDEWAG